MQPGGHDPSLPTWRPARQLSALATLAFVALGVLSVPGRAAAADLAVGASAVDPRVTVTVTGTRTANTYSSIGGHWFVADVSLVGGTGIDTSPLLDWKLILPSGQEITGFPGQGAALDGGRVEAGQDVVLQLGFMVTDAAIGPAVLAFRPFMEQTPIGRWSVMVDAAPAPEPGAVPGITVPQFSVPPFSVPDFTVPAIDVSSFGEHVESFDAEYDVQADGGILVKETIAYDFGSQRRHGIFRDLAAFQPIDSDHERKYPLSDVNVAADPGAPAQYELLRNGDFRRIKIGDPDQTIEGVHTYTITYRLGGALNPQPSGPELYFNVTGRWPVAMSKVSIAVRGPGGVQRVACFAGSTGSTSACTSATIGDGIARFVQDGLGAGTQLTVVSAFPAGSVNAGSPIIGDAPRTIDDAIEPDAGNIGGSAAVGLLGLAGIGSLVWRKGRDLESSGSPVDAVFAPGEQPARRLPILRGVPTPVQFEPPDKAPPGLLGTLYDERADTVDVSATIVDLAVRGFMRIEEVPKSGLFGKTDHRFVRLRHDTDGTLLPYERRLFNGLFASGDDVLLSSLKNTFASTLTKVKTDLYKETVRRRWFDTRPDSTRTRWVLIGVGVATLGIGALLAAAATKYWLWPAIALLVIGIVFVIAARWMPRRTAHGTAVLRLAEGFRTFIVESESRRAEFAERAHLFTEYLPYAIVFGCVDKWAKAFAGLDGQLPDTGAWYVGTGPFNVHHFSRSMDSFSSSAASTMSSTPGGSGGSGFSGGSSGGGGGGGGGGSW